MSNERNTRAYDLFKLIVAIILLVIFILLFLQPPQLTPQVAAEATLEPALPAPTNTLPLEPTLTATTPALPPYPGAAFEWAYALADNTLADPQGRVLYRLDAENQAWVPVIPPEIQAALPAGTSLAAEGAEWVIVDADGKLLYRWDTANFIWAAEQPAVTEASEATATSAPEATATPEASPTPTAEAPATATPTPTPSAAASAGTGSTVVCAGALPSRLKVGDTVRVTTSLNVRNEPGIGENLLFTNPTNTQLEVIGGPVCLEYQGSAYVWWQVEMADGQSGWSAEATLNGSFYFLEPLP
jgi:hypothetical protein